VTIRKATPADISRLCKTANIAFADDPVCGSSSRRRRVLAATAP